MSTFADRILRALRLDPQLFEEVEMDQGALKQAAAVVILSSASGGLGTLLPNVGLQGLLEGILAALAGWIVWVFTIYFVGLKLIAGPMTYSNLGELLRATGFASAPGLIRILGIFPPLRTAVFFIALFWMLAAMVIAVRQALDYSSTLQAVFVCIGGWFFQTLIVLVILGLNGLIDSPIVR